ncbi:hypothetical protein B7463_g3012, partial [Scytalidium lignicola]
MATSTRHPISIQDLPDEILADIFTYLDSPPPSPPRLYKEPNFEVTDSTSTSLKDISRVSSRWRQIALPLLFRHARLKVWGNKISLLRRSTIHEWFSPLSDFLTKKSLGPVVLSFTLCVESDRSLPTAQERHSMIEFSNFWEFFFKILDPIDILIVAPVRVVGIISGCHVSMQDAFFLDCPYHYLLLQREISDPHSSIHNVSPVLNASDTQSGPSHDPSTSQTSSIIHHLDNHTTTKSTSTIFTIRPWTKLLLNEGSFIKAYSMDSYWMREPPSILDHLLGGAAHNYPAIIPDSIHTLSYIGIFPIASHFAIITRNLPMIDRLYVQLVPRSDILENPSKMVNVDSEDLWMERNTCYALLMREMFNVPPTDNYKHLKEFESGDAADRDSWHMAVEYVKRDGNGWKVAGDGVFVKNPQDIKRNQEKDDPDDSLFEGSLVRWAWNVTMSKKAPKGEYIETETGNKVSRRSQIIGSTNIILGGKTVIQAEVIIRGDLIRTLGQTPSTSSSDGKSTSGNPVAVAIGRYCFFSRGCELRPPAKVYKGSYSHFPLKIGDHVFVGSGSIIEAALIGSHVYIGSNCVIGKFSLIKDFVRILDGTVVPPNMVIPAFSIVAGVPGRVVGEILEGEVEGFDLREVYRSVGNAPLAS